MLDVLTLSGWIGAGTVVGAYACVSRGALSPTGRTFQSLNLSGAGLLAVSAWADGAWPSAVVNLIWVAIAIQVIVTVTRGTRASQQTPRQSVGKATVDSSGARSEDEDPVLVGQD